MSSNCCPCSLQPELVAWRAETFKRAPMGCRSPTGEQPGGVENEGACTYRVDCFTGARLRTDEGEHVTIAHLSACALAAWDQHVVEWRALHKSDMRID